MSAETWAVVEVMGHRRHAGRIAEVHRFGATLIQVDVPMEDESFTTFFYSGNAIFGLRLVTEEDARNEARRQRGTYVPAQLPVRAMPAASVDNEDEESDYDAGRAGQYDGDELEQPCQEPTDEEVEKYREPREVEP